MSAYEDAVLSARFAVLASEPLAADWEDVLGRAGKAPPSHRRFAHVFQGRRRRPLVVLAAVVLVLVVGAASALAVRAILVSQGIIGLAPVGATPSTPAKGELALSFMFGHTMGDPGRFLVSVYADGRMIWQRNGDYSLPVTNEDRNSTGWLERRLTPEGVELVRAEVLSSGLVDHDLNLTGGEGLTFGFIDFRTGERRVRVTWGDGLTVLDVGPDVPRKWPTPAQASALVRLDKRLEDPTSWLPASAWEDREIRAFVPSAYSICLEGKKELGLSRVLALLPPAAQDLLRTQENTPGQYTNLIGTFVVWCSRLTNDEARALERILDDAGVRGSKSEFGLEYGVSDIAHAGPTDFTLSFDPTFPEQE